MAKFKASAMKQVMGIKTVIQFDAQGEYETDDEKEVELLSSRQDVSELGVKKAPVKRKAPIKKSELSVNEDDDF